MIKFALNGSSWVLADDYEPGMECLCPACGEQLAGRSSEHAPSHYFHTNSTDCDLVMASRLAMTGGAPEYFSGRVISKKITIPPGDIHRTRGYSKSFAEVAIEKDIVTLEGGLGSYGFCVIEGIRLPILFDYNSLYEDSGRDERAEAKMLKKFDYFARLHVTEHSLSTQRDFNAIDFLGSKKHFIELRGKLIDLNPVRTLRFPQLYCLTYMPDSGLQSDYFRKNYEEGPFIVCFFSYSTYEYIYEPKLKKEEFLKSFNDQLLAESKWQALEKLQGSIKFFLSFHLTDRNFHFSEDNVEKDCGLSEYEYGIWDARPFRRERYSRVSRRMKSFFKRSDDEFDEVAMGPDNPYKKSFRARWGV